MSLAVVFACAGAALVTLMAVIRRRPRLRAGTDGAGLRAGTEGAGLRAGTDGAGLPAGTNGASLRGGASWLSPMASRGSPATRGASEASGSDPAGGEAPRSLCFRIEGDRVLARDRAARSFLSAEAGPLHAFVARLTPVEGAADLGLALRALEADGRPFRALADDGEGRSWELAGRPEAGEARLALTPAGPARREIARLRGMLAMLASDRDQAAEALEAAPLLAWRRSPAGRIVWGNALYRRLASAQEAYGTDAAPLPELRHDGGDGYGARPPEGRRSVFDARTGERRWFELTELPAADGGALGYGVDAASAVHAEGALRRFVETLTETFAHLAIGLAIFDREARLGLFNPAFASLMRLDPAWLAGRPSLSDVLEKLRANRRLPDHENFQLWRAEMLELFRAEGGQDRPERTEVWHLPGELQIRVVARPHPQGAVAFLFEDVSETARLERRFATETEIRRAVMDRLEEGVVAFGPDGAARFMNPAFAAIWAPRDETEEALELLRSAESGAEPLRLAQTLAMFRARSPSAAVWDRLAAFFGAPADRAAEEIRGALLEQVSSRVRSPLARILGLGLALRDEAEDAGATPEALARIDRVLEAASEVQSALSGVADLASAQAGVLSLTPERVNLRAALVSALEMARRRAGERGVILSLEAAAPAGAVEEVSGDAARVRQLLFNLVTDAVHRAGPGDEVRAGALSKGGEVELWTDAPDTAGEAEDARLRRGLAHALVRRFSELHGGDVRIERREEAGGPRRRVTCTLPVEALRVPGQRRASAVA